MKATVGRAVVLKRLSQARGPPAARRRIEKHFAAFDRGVVRERAWKIKFGETA